MYIIIVIIIIIVVIILIKKWKTKPRPRPRQNGLQIATPIGNHLCVYFYKMGFAFLQGQNFHYDTPNEQIFRHLPKDIELDKTIQNELHKHKFTTDELIKEENKPMIWGMWRIWNSRRHLFWKILKPKIYIILNDALYKTGISYNHNNVVIHFRCSDVPFNRHFDYRLQKYGFFKYILNDIKKRNLKYDKIVILSCSDHESDEDKRRICKIWTENLYTYIKDNLKQNIEIKCNTNTEDFGYMFYAPIVISTGGSFSFMSGFFNKGVFYSGGHLSKINPERCNDCEWSIGEYTIEHEEIQDYYDVDTILLKLKEE